MAQTQVQYSPAQILDAARRAEADGRREYASQYFRLLVDQYPTSHEAAIAHEGLNRLSAAHNTAGAGTMALAEPNAVAQPQSPNAQGPSLQPPNQTHQNLPHTQPPGAAAPLNQGDPTTGPGHRQPPPGQQPQGQPSQGQTLPAQQLNSPQTNPPQPGAHHAPGASASHHPGAPGTYGQNPRQAAAQPGRLNLEPVAGVETADRRPPFPEPRLRRHILGNICATLLIVLGSCAIVLAIAAATSLFLAPGLLSAITGSRSFFAGISNVASLLTLGLFLVVSGLAARSVFANARTLHDLAMAEYSRRPDNRRGN